LKQGLLIGLNNRMESAIVQYTKDVVISHPTPLDLIGKGAFGKVYKYHNDLDDVTYAVKKILLTQECANNTLKEVRVLANLNHPNIVRYFHSWLEAMRISECNLIEQEEESDQEDENEVIRVNGNQYYMCIRMEYCESNLTKYLEASDRSKIGDFRNQIITGVSYLHSKGIIHRDLKPDNILIYQQNIIKITDFGLAKTFTSGQLKKISSFNTTFAGTMLYASPEQYEGKPYGTDTDIYSLGILFFEMQQIFKTNMERIQEIQKLRLNLSSLSIQHEPIILSMISEPESRPDITQVQEYFYQEHNYLMWCRDIVWMIVMNAIS